jgi:hypothetical protein
MHTVTLRELQTVLKVSTQTGQSGAVHITSLESTAQDDDFQEVKKHNRRVSIDTSEMTVN